MLTLRPYQQDLVARVESATARRVLVVLPTGGGKTAIAEALTDAELQRGGRVVFIVDREELASQAQSRLGGDRLMGRYGTDGTARVVTAGVATLARRGVRPEATLVIVDEAHCYLAESYRRVVDSYRDSGARIVGLTATPARLDGQGLGELFDEIVEGPPMTQLIADGYLVPVRTFAPTGPWWERVGVRAGDFRADELGDAANAVLRDVVGAWRTAGGSSRLTLAFACTKRHAADLAARWEQDADVAAEVVTDDTPHAERVALKQRLVAGDTRVVVNVGILGVGWDFPAVSCIVMARPTLSWGLYLQQCLDERTEVLTRRGWKRHDEIEGGDLVAAMDTRSGIASWETIESSVVRPLGPSESMYSINGPHLSLRVTGGHEMVVRCRRGIKWRKSAAESAARYGGMWEVPVSATLPSRTPAPLSDDEIRFLGWFLTDGAITAKGRAVSISQSANATAMCAKIRAVLGGCGFRFGESHVKRTGIYAHYADNVQFNVSMAEPRKLTDRHLRGCGKLSGWLDKTIPPLYETLDERQLGVLIDSMNDGDGVKAAVSWERRTFSITTGDNEQMADRLQALLVTNGYRCNKATWRPKDRKPQYTLHIRPGARTASVAGMNDSDGAVAGRAYRRSRFSACPSVPGELVWCIGNRVGTLITRRDGKVAVVGNCGRGTRPAPGKRDLLLVDCAGNALRHGLVTRPFPVSLDGLARKHRRAVAGLTTCRTCFRVYEPDEPSCPGCGAARPHTERRIRQVGGELIEMTGAEVFAERATQSQQVRLLARWTREAAARGWKPGAPMARFRGLWKRWPSAQEIREARELAAGGAP